jgi:hypothetical protein
MAISTQAICNRYLIQFVILSNAYSLVRIETIYYASARYASILRKKLIISSVRSPCQHQSSTATHAIDERPTRKFFHLTLSL